MNTTDLPITPNNSPDIINKILTILSKQFPNSTSDLLHHSPYELLVATILSAQCTDKQVNSVTPALFDKYPTPDFLAIAEAYEVENTIRSVGFYKTKAKNIIATAALLVEKYNSEVPLSLKELVKLPGVGRKTANCVLSYYSTPEGIVVDTHVIRLSNLLGLVNEKDPVKIETSLMDIVAKRHWATFTHYLIKHGRATCIARRPQCAECCISKYCNYFAQIGRYHV